MRPPDENQLGSTRPHLNSARRPASANSNILASLERLANKQHSRTAPHSNRAWLGAGALVVLGLIGTIAWLAHVNATTLRPLPVADARGRPLPDTPASAARVPAAIIDEPAERAILLAKAEIPPLVMLRPAAPPMVERTAPTPKRAPAKKAAPPKAAAAPRKSPAPAPKAEQEAVDSDVALLSAILSYSSRHAAERAQMDEAACQAGKKCPAKGPVEP